MGTRRTREVTAEQAVAYRVAVHNLHEPLPPDRVVDAARVAAVQDTPPGNAGVAFAGRVRKLRPTDVEAALHENRTLLRMFGPRGAVHVMPRDDGMVFGPGSLAADEESLREQLTGAWPAIEAAGYGAQEALGSVLGVLTTVLADAEPRTKGQLSEALHGRVPPELEPWCEVCDVHHVPEQLFRLAGMAGAYVYGWPHGTRQTLIATDVWLGGPLGGDLREARIELARRFVHAYGPTGPRLFAGWVGTSPIDARERFDALAPELVTVRLDGAPAVMLADDVELLDDPPLAAGARLLPAGDPFLALRDRATLLPDRTRQRALWRPAGSPGLVLMTGRPVGIWRAAIARSTLRVTVEPFVSLGDRQRTAIEQAAATVAPFRGRDEVDLKLA
jgi:Winged helix DNA-binding domain